MAWNRLDELITDIKADETISLSSGMLDKECQARIENRIYEQIFSDNSSMKKDGNGASESIKCPDTKNKTGRRKLSKRKSFIVLLAAALVVAFSLTAGAAVSNEWDIALVNFMGISNADTIQLEGGVVEIGAEDICEGTDYSEDIAGKPKEISISATTSIGDKNAAYIRFETNYQVPEGFDETKDYILPDDFSVHAYSRKSGKGASEVTVGNVFTCLVENGKLSFLLYIYDYEKLNKSYISVSFQDLRLYHDLNLSEEEQELAEASELLYTGNWELNWKYSYKSNVKTYHMLKKIEQDDVTYYLTQIEVSPMAIRMKAVKNLKDRNSEVENLDIEEIQFEDGRTISVEGTSSFGSRNEIWMRGSCDMETIGEVLDPKKVESVTVAGKEIKLR